MNKQVKVKSFTPKAISKAVFNSLLGVSFGEAARFDEQIKTRVDLEAKNTRNIQHRDVEAFKVVQIAKEFKIDVVLP